MVDDVSSLGCGGIDYLLGVPFTRVRGKKLKYQYVAMIKGVEAVKGELSALDKQLSLIFQREVSS